jgi:lysophospholipase L1-like esterase
MDDSAESRDPYCLTADDEDALLRGAPWTRFVVVGDSIAKGVFEEVPGYRSVPWPARVAEALRRQQPTLELLNVARMFALSEEVLAEQVPPALEFGPDLAAIVCGGNDVLVPAWDPARTELALDRIIGTFADAGAEVITFTMFDIVKALDMPPEMGADLDSRLSTLADMTRLLSQRYGTLHVEMRVHPACSEPSLYATGSASAHGRVNRRRHDVVRTCAGLSSGCDGRGCADRSAPRAR